MPVMGRFESRTPEVGINVKQTLSTSADNYLRALGFIYQSGKKITAQVKSGKVYQGLFQAYHPEGKDGGGLVLEFVRLITDENGKSPPVKAEHRKSLVILSRDLVKFSCNDVPKPSEVRDSSSSAGGFATDKDIGRNRGGLSGRKLEKWVPPADCTDMSLEEMDGPQRKGGHGWDQFKTNEERFNVKSDWDENLYTTPLDVRNSNISVAEATRLANEIESKARSSRQLTAHEAEERGMEVDDALDEEARYGAVLTPEQLARLKPRASSSAGGPPGLHRDRDGAAKPERIGSAQSRTPASSAKETPGAGESRLPQRSWETSGAPPARAAPVRTPTAPMDIVPPRRDQGRPREHLQSGSQIKALDLQVPNVKFTPDQVNSFKEYKAGMKTRGTPDSMKAFPRASTQAADGSLAESKGGRNGLDNRATAPAIASTSSTPQKAVYASGQADYRPAGGTPPSTSIVVAAGGTAAAATASAPPDKPAADALAVPPLIPEPVHPANNAPALAPKPLVVSKLNPLAKEWKPSGTPTSSKPSTAAAPSTATGATLSPAIGLQQMASGPSATFHGHQNSQGQGGPYFPGPGAMMGPGSGPGPGSRNGGVPPNAGNWDSHPQRVGSSGPGKGRMDREPQNKQQQQQQQQQQQVAYYEEQMPVYPGQQLVPGPNGAPMLQHGAWIPPNYIPPPPNSYSMGGNPTGDIRAMVQNPAQQVPAFMQPGPGFPPGGMAQMHQMPAGYMPVPQMVPQQYMSPYGGVMPMPQGPRGPPQWQAGSPQMVPHFMQGGPGMVPPMMQQPQHGHMDMGRGERHGGKP